MVVDDTHVDNDTHDKVNINTIFSLRVIEVRDEYVPSTIPSIVGILKQLSKFCSINDNHGTKPALLRCYFQIIIMQKNTRMSCTSTAEKMGEIVSSH